MGDGVGQGLSRVALLTLLLLGGFGSLAAQEPDTLTSILRDSLADTLASQAEKFVDPTQQFLEVQEAGNQPVPVVPALGPAGPMPPNSRIVLGPDSLAWATAETLGDILSHVTGTYDWRGGWIGRNELTNFRSRGTAAIEYYLDGLPYIPVGSDSLAIDPSLFPLSLLQSVEIDRWPGQLRVYLATRRHARRAPRSTIGISSGDLSLARYIGSIEKRFPSGVGFALAVDVLNAPTASGQSSAMDATTFWVQGGYARPTFGVQYSFIGMAVDRTPFVNSAADTVGNPLNGTRYDGQLRGYWRNRADGLGLEADVVYAQTWWTSDSLDQSVQQVGGIVTWRTPTLMVGGSAFYRTRWTPTDFRGQAGWSPSRLVTLSGEVGRQSMDSSRHSTWAGVRAGLQLPLGFQVTGTLVQGSVVAAPSVATDTAQHISDQSLVVAWNRPSVSIQAGLSRTSQFNALAFQPYRDIVAFRPTPSTTWIDVSARVRPVNWITLEGWYSSPSGSSPDGLPPDHLMVAGTIRSKFLRTFPSGIFDLKLQLVGERWGAGTIGRDALGAPIVLPSATFLRLILQIQLDSFIIYLDRFNLANSQQEYVPGFNYPLGRNTFGVRWTFLN